ncbi:unnamed protein product [Cuscuta campestris]|uniref:Ammonium transporter AmtB-like domain-containing protein n=1 Tax=Cuscuta campestris TaxID=132261 RepID=A0A484NJM7_9ASTE|nr:unnamed protein product [Cuscuta campestris]
MILALDLIALGFAAGGVSSSKQGSHHSLLSALTIGAVVAAQVCVTIYACSAGFTKDDNGVCTCCNIDGAMFIMTWVFGVIVGAYLVLVVNKTALIMGGLIVCAIHWVLVCLYTYHAPNPSSTSCRGTHA